MIIARRITHWTLLGLLLVGCGTVAEVSNSPAFYEPEPIQTAPAQSEPLNSTPSAVPTLAQTATPALPTQSPTPTITPTPLHPLMIEVMRQQSYPGSPIVFEETLDQAALYDRYIISYQSEGNKIYALLTIPRGERPATGWPVIVFNHGFIPPDQYRTTERYVAYVDNLARSEYIIIRPDYRGHGNSEGRATGGYGTPDYTVDVLNALASIKAYPDADPNRIGMWGHSMGGQITLRAMVVSDDIKAGVIWGGVVGSYADLLEYWHRPSNPNELTPTPDPTRTRGRWRTELIETYGYPEENPAFWASISPNAYVSDLSGPIQLHHGEADQSVPIILSELLQGELKAAGVYVEFYRYEGDDHDITTNFTLAMQRTIQFFNTYVKGSS